MSYEVIENFFDIEDNRRLYEVGQSYPREGFKPSEERVVALSSRNNKGKQPFIKLVEDKEAPKDDEPGIDLEDLKKDELLSFIKENLNGEDAPTKGKSEKVADYEARLRGFIEEGLVALESGE
ncbi:hypothetical protein [Bacillus sp. MRMR6]|uniref:hypothetical protein n=1 Tax=Bacillus sp. MRMR6 TaxID=1928617 RepID=UPI0009523CCF|nr:hypothetical protein [Bacillus sp. MRMR6]OLS39134.1 hypothetical protein BTR25_13460 [Bacillus sp. MRMR6]